MSTTISSFCTDCKCFSPLRSEVLKYKKSSFWSLVAVQALVSQRNACFMWRDYKKKYKKITKEIQRYNKIHTKSFPFGFWSQCKLWFLIAMHFSCERITKDSFSAKVQPRSFSPWYWKWSQKHHLKLSLSRFAPWYWNTRKWSPKHLSKLSLFFSSIEIHDCDLQNILWNFHFYFFLPGVEIQDSDLQNILRNFHFRLFLWDLDILILSSYRVIICYLTLFSLSFCVFVFPMYFYLYLSFPSLLWLPCHFPKVATFPATLAKLRGRQKNCQGMGGVD